MRTSMSNEHVERALTKLEQQDDTRHPTSELCERPALHVESRPEVITASDQHREDVVSIMTLGFADDPVCRQLYPDPAQYMTFFPEFVRLYGGAAFDHEGAHLVKGIGAALWFPPGAHPDGDAINNLIGRSVTDSAKAELFEVYEEMSRGHPKEPHWFLPLIAIDPFLRGKGFGAALMEYGLAACDRDGAPAYLDSTHRRNIPFYTPPTSQPENPWD